MIDVLKNKELVFNELEQVNSRVIIVQIVGIEKTCLEFYKWNERMVVLRMMSISIWFLSYLDSFDS